MATPTRDEWLPWAADAVMYLALIAFVAALWLAVGQFDQTAITVLACAWIALGVSVVLRLHETRVSRPVMGRCRQTE